MRAPRYAALTVTVVALILGLGCPAPAEEAQEPAWDRTPPRLAFISGAVSFWRPGADEWSPGRTNTPLAPGDQLYAAAGANLEVQIGPRAFVRASGISQLGLESLEPDFLQFKVTGGHVAFDLRDVRAGQTVEVATPNAAFTIERSGYYVIDVSGERTSLIARRGGRALATPAGGRAAAIAPSEQVMITGTESPTLETYVAPELSEWDRWNYARTDALIESLSARYVPPGVYGADDLDHHGTWRVVADYGPVWLPDRIPPGWAPYSTGRWVWDPYYGWTWIDDAPWGWAPYHYGRWVHVGGHWGWAPGPVVVRPYYSPALVAFFGFGGGAIAIGHPVGWVALGWGEPIVPWWGPVAFIGRPWWAGWGGPRVVNNVVVHKTTVVNVTNITVYRNTSVTNAIVSVPATRFGAADVASVRVRHAETARLVPVHGAHPVKPNPASLLPATGPTPRPAEDLRARPVVVTRRPQDPIPALQQHGLPSPAGGVGPKPKVVERTAPEQDEPQRPPFGKLSGPERSRPTQPPPPGRADRAPSGQRRERDAAAITPRPSAPRPEGQERAAPGREATPAPSAAPQPSAPPAQAPARPQVTEPPGRTKREAPPPAAQPAPSSPAAVAPTAPTPAPPAGRSVSPGQAQRPAERAPRPSQVAPGDSRGQAVAVPSPGVVQPPRPQGGRRDLPGEPANRLYPGQPAGPKDRGDGPPAQGGRSDREPGRPR